MLFTEIIVIALMTMVLDIVLCHFKVATMSGVITPSRFDDSCIAFWNAMYDRQGAAIHTPSVWKIHHVEKKSRSRAKKAVAAFIAQERARRKHRAWWRVWKDVVQTNALFVGLLVADQKEKAAKKAAKDRKDAIRDLAILTKKVVKLAEKESARLAAETVSAGSDLKDVVANPKEEKAAAATAINKAAFSQEDVALIAGLLVFEKQARAFARAKKEVAKEKAAFEAAGIAAKRFEEDTKGIATVNTMAAAYLRLLENSRLLVIVDGKFAVGHHNTVRHHVELINNKGLTAVTCRSNRIEGLNSSVRSIGVVTLMPSGEIIMGRNKNGIQLGNNTEFENEVCDLMEGIFDLEQTHPDHFWMSLHIAAETLSWGDITGCGIEATIDAMIRNLEDEFPELPVCDLGIAQDVEAAWDSQDRFQQELESKLFEFSADRETSQNVHIDTSLPDVIDCCGWEGDIVVSKVMAHKCVELAQNKFSAKVIMGKAMVNDGLFWTEKTIAVFHGSTNAESHMEAWWDIVFEEADILICCNWAIAIPSFYHHKALPMWYSRVTGKFQVEVMKTRSRAAVGLSHPILGYWNLEEKANAVTFNWSQLWRHPSCEEAVMGTEEIKPELKEWHTNILCRYSWEPQSWEDFVRHYCTSLPEEAIAKLLQEIPEDDNRTDWASTLKEVIGDCPEKWNMMQAEGLGIHLNYATTPLKISFPEKFEASYSSTTLNDLQCLLKASLKYKFFSGQHDAEGDCFSVHFDLENNRIVFRLEWTKYKVLGWEVEEETCLIYAGKWKLKFIFEALEQKGLFPKTKISDEYENSLHNIYARVKTVLFKQKDIVVFRKEDDILSVFNHHAWPEYYHEEGISCMDFGMEYSTEMHDEEHMTGIGRFWTKYEASPKVYNWMSWLNLVKAYVVENKKGQIVGRFLLFTDMNKHFVVSPYYGEPTFKEAYNSICNERLFGQTMFVDINMVGNAPYIDVHPGHRYVTQAKKESTLFEWTHGSISKNILVGHKEDILKMSSDEIAEYEYVFCCDRAEVAKQIGLKPYGDTEKYPLAFQHEMGGYIMTNQEKTEGVAIMLGVDYKMPKIITEELVALGNELDGFQTGEFKAVNPKVHFEFEMPDLTGIAAWTGDVYASPSVMVEAGKLAKYKTKYKVLVGPCVVKTEKGFEHKTAAFFHGHNDPSKHQQEWFLEILEMVDLIICCNFVCAIPERLHHKALPMYLSKMLEISPSILEKTIERGRQRELHSIWTNWWFCGDLPVRRLEWGLCWDKSQEGLDLMVCGTEGIKNVVGDMIFSFGPKEKSSEPNKPQQDTFSPSFTTISKKEANVEKETTRHLLVVEGSKTCKRQKDGSITLKFKNSPYLRVFNSVTGSDKNRPVIKGHGAAPDENLQGVVLQQVAYKGYVGDQGTLPVAKLGGDDFLPGTYRRIGYAWAGVSNFGIYGGKAEDEEARSASQMRIQSPRHFEVGEDFELYFVDFSNPKTVPALIKAGAFVASENNSDIGRLITEDMQGKDFDKEPQIDGTIWVSSQGPNFAPPMPKGEKKATYQFRGTCLFPEEVGHEVAFSNQGFSPLWHHIYDLLPKEDREGEDWVTFLFGCRDEYVAQWIAGRTKDNILFYIGSDRLTVEQMVQIIVGDLAIKKSVEIHQAYFDKTHHYGAYLKGLVATRSYLKKNVCLIDINAVKDISKNILKKELKANGGVIKAKEGHEYVIGMMQDYSRGGIRVQSQPNTYIRSHHKGDFVMEPHIDRFANFLFKLIEQMSTGIGVAEVLENLKKGMKFSNSGESEFELDSFFEDLEETARGYAPAMWNHQAGRAMIKNTFKVLCSRYSFGFMTEAMKQIGTFVSVKSYITDLNILPAAYQNKQFDKHSVFIEFEGEQKFEQKLPLTVVLFVNDKFWKALGRNTTLAGILRYPVSNEDMFSGCLVVSPEAIIFDELVKDLCGFKNYSAETLKWFFAGLSNGIYANSLTIKELLCGDSDGDTVGLVPMNVGMTLDEQTVIAHMDNADSKFLWAIHEVRDLKKRAFLELEGFTHLQGNRKINPAAVEDVLTESNKGIGPCALFQQACRGILDTYDKNEFVVREDYSKSHPQLQKEENQIPKGKEMATFRWFVERYLIPSYRILPCSLELAIMSQKKDLMAAYYEVTKLLVNENGHVVYGENNDRYSELFDVELVKQLREQAHEPFVVTVEKTVHGLLEQTGWASSMGRLAKLVMLVCHVGTKDGFIQWITSTRTSAMSEKENPETLLADQTDEAWGIRQPDNLAWTNNYWVAHISPVMRKVRESIESLIRNTHTFKENDDLRLSWNRVYDRGSFNRLNLRTFDYSDGITVADKEQFMKEIATWFKIKVTSRLFGLNLHGWNKFDSTTVFKKKEDKPKLEHIYITTKEDVFSMVVLWAYFQMVMIEQKHQSLAEFTNSLCSLIERDLDVMDVMKNITDNLFDLEAQEENKDDIIWLSKVAKSPQIGDLREQALHLYVKMMKEDIQTSEYLWTIQEAYKFLFEVDSLDGLGEKIEQTHKTTAFIMKNLNVCSLFVDGKIDKDVLKELYQKWKTLQASATKFLASKYRAMNKETIEQLVKHWSETEYASIFALAHQETQSYHAMSVKSAELKHIKSMVQFSKNETYRARVLTDYTRELVIKNQLPTSICSFLKVDRFLLEFVSSEMENRRFAFGRSLFQFTFVEKAGCSLGKGRISIEPIYHKTADVELHALEVSQNNQVVGWLVSDPTARVLLYFNDEELSCMDISDNLELNNKGSVDLTRSLETRSALLYEAPHSINDQRLMVEMFVANYPEANRAKYKIALFEAQMNSLELIFGEFIKSINKIIGYLNYASFDGLKKKKTIEKVLASNQLKPNIVLCEKLGGNAEFYFKFWQDLLAEYELKAFHQREVESDSYLQRPLEPIKEISLSIGLMTYHHSYGITEVDYPEDFLMTEEEQNQMFIDQVEVLTDVPDFDDSVFQEDEHPHFEDESVYYPEDEFCEEPELIDFDMNDAVFEQEEVFEETAEIIEEMIEIVEDKLKEADMPKQKEVVVFEDNNSDAEILDQINKLVEKLDPKIQAVFKKAVNLSNEKLEALEKEKAELLEKKKAAEEALRAIEEKLSKVEQEIQAIESDDDDDGGDDGGGNGGAPIPATPAPSTPLTPSPISSSSKEAAAPKAAALSVLSVPSNYKGHEVRTDRRIKQTTKVKGFQIKVNPNKVCSEFETLSFCTPSLKLQIELDPFTFENVEDYLIFCLECARQEIRLDKEGLELHQVANKCILAALAELKIPYEENTCLPTSQQINEAFASQELSEKQLEKLEELSKQCDQLEKEQEQLKQELNVLVVTGGRDFDDRAYVYEKLDKALAEFNFTKLISGAARGLDTLAIEWAKERGVECLEMPAQWNRQPDGSYDKNAGYRRNEAMAQLASICMVFPGGNGTAHMHKTCQKRGLKILNCAANYAPPVKAITVFRGEYAFLSNFAFCKVVRNNIAFKSVEHFYQHEKFSDHPEIQQEIRAAKFAVDTKRIANKNKEKVRKDWDEVKDRVMWFALRQKFQDPKFKQQLLDTQDAKISHENTWRDTYWGVCQGVGEDRLGEMLEALRDELKGGA